MATPEISHGRGGAGNFNPDDTQYHDGEVVRVGVEGSHGDGAYSSGRGGKSIVRAKGPTRCLFPLSKPKVTSCDALHGVITHPNRDQSAGRDGSYLSGLLAWL